MHRFGLRTRKGGRGVALRVSQYRRRSDTTVLNVLHLSHRFAATNNFFDEINALGAKRTAINT